jgi:FkbM family methyltransferase
MEERADYMRYGLNNTIWIEANPELYATIVRQISDNEKAINYAVAETSDKYITLYCTTNSQSSSVLPLGSHKKYYPNIVVSHTKEIITQRVDDIISKHNILIDNYNFINVDIQGVELRALKSFGNLLSKIDFIYTEVNREHLYENCDLITDIDEYLEKFSFSRAEVSWTDSNWGDALYVKRLTK